jgi:hypothetical protein
MTRLHKAAAAAVVLAAVVLAPVPGHAQSVDSAADDLLSHNVTFEDGAVSDQDIADLDSVTAQLQADRGYFKVVVLASPVDEFSSTRAYAEQVRSALGGTGRVLVFDPDDVGIASNVPGEAAGINDAELAAIDAANRSNSFATGVLAAADALGVKGSAGGSGEPGGSGSASSSPGSSSSGNGLVIVVMIALVGVVGFLFYRWWSARRKQQGPSMSPQAQAEGEQKVRAEVEAASNLVIDLADRAELPDAPPEAVSAFRDGAIEFADLQDDLEAADTREELEAVFPRLVHARWKLECAKAVLDGTPAPLEPTATPLFPPPPPPTPGAPPAPEPHYQRHQQHSPWLTKAAVTAITVLASRGLGNPGDGGRRQPSDDDWFRDRYGGGRGSGSRSSGRSRPRISMGGRRGSSSGRGMGHR